MKMRNLCISVFALGLLAVGVGVASCRQDPIFFNISTETALKKPKIEGAPTNMVEFVREYDSPVHILYVASGRLHWYARTEKGKGEQSGWDSADYDIEQPAGKIISLAAAQDRLYALCMEGHGVDATLRYIGNNENDKKWENVHSAAGDYPLLQSIYTDPDTDRLFVGARTGEDATYAILYLDDDDTLKILKRNTSIFSGVTYRGGTYYLCTRGNGIFQVDETDLQSGNEGAVEQLKDKSESNDSDKDNRMFMGMIKLEDATIIAVERDGGALYEVNDGSFARMKYSGGERDREWIKTDKYATGALALWENDDASRKMLIAGIQGSLYNTTTSSYTHGYVEFGLRSSDGSFDTASARRDAGQLQSVRPDGNERYTASLGKHPINYLFQAPSEIDEEKTFFASTQAAGLWSYRDREDNGGWQWNAEE